MLASLALAGCSTPGASVAAAQPERSTLAASGSFALAARFSLRVDEQNHSGRLDWQHSPTSDEWLLSSPFGQGLAEIVSTPAVACLSAGDGRRECDASLDALTQRVLGYPLPLAGLADWVRGRGAEGGRVDALGRPLALARDGWYVDLAYDSDAADAADAPPGRLFISRPGGPELRLVIDAWTLPLGANDAPAAGVDAISPLVLPVVPATALQATPLPAATPMTPLSADH
nr:outer membrane lipoprotein LolB [Rhodocyclus tenuis]